MSVTPYRMRVASWVTGAASLGAVLAMLMSSLMSPTVLANARPGVTSSAQAPSSTHDPRTLAQKRYAAWLAKQQQRFESAKMRETALAKAGKLPKWKASAHEVTSAGSARPRTSGVVSPKTAVPVTTDPNNWTALGPQPLSYYGSLYSNSVTGVSTSATNASDVWISTGTGGVWHSTDGGATWTATTDSQPTLAFGAIAVDPTNDHVIYAGSGDPDDFGYGYPGMGIFESTDNGVTWTQEQASTFANTDVFRIAIDPSNDQNVLAAVGANYSDPTVSGLWETTDGGTTWSQVLADSSNANFTAAYATDVVFDPANSAIVYAALGNFSGSQSSTSVQGIYKSTDHGATWTLLSGGPTGQNVGRVSLAISQDGAHLYVAAADSGFSNSGSSYGALLNSSIYEYASASDTWTTTSEVGTTLDTNGELQYGWNSTNAIAVTPTDSTGATLILGHFGTYRSVNSGASWTVLGSGGSAGFGQNSLYYPSPAGSAFFDASGYGIWHYASGLFANDNAGLDISSMVGGAYGDNGAYSPLYAQNVAPTYGTYQYAPGNTGASAWTFVQNAYAGATVDWSNNANVYTPLTTCSNQNCSATSTTVEKSTDGGSTFNVTSLSTSDAVGYNVPPTISATNPQKLFLGTTRVWATTNGGSSWSLISPQLDTTPTPYGSGTCTGPSDTNCPFIIQVVVAPSTDSELVVTYSDGRSYVTTNGGASWYPAGMLCAGQTGCANGYVQYAVSPSDPMTIYAAGYYSSASTSASGVFVSTNGGYSWSILPASTSLPTTFFNSIAVSPADSNVLVVSSYVGAFFSPDGGLDWSSIGGLPNVDITNAFFSHDGSQSLMSTIGRGVWGLAMPHLTLSTQAITLTTAPGSSPANQTVTLGNSGQGTLTWSTTGLPSWLSISPSSGAIAAGGSQAVTLSFNTPSTTPQTYMTELAFNTNADNSGPSPTQTGLVNLPVMVSSRLSKTWYFAEGYTGGSFSEYLTLANPNPVAATVNVEYLLQNGSAPITKTYTVNANARQTVEVNTELGIGVGVSMVVTSDQPIIAERPMYFTYSNGGLTVPGGTDVLGATTLASQFDFGYLDTTANHQTYLTVLNPSSNQMAVTVNYYAAGGGAPTTVTHTVPPNARGTILVNTDVPAGSYSALVTLSANGNPVGGLVERPMYLVDGSTGYTGSADVVGVPSATTSWSFAEGFTGSGFSERYILSNPGSVTANVTVTFQRADGTTKTQSVSLAADTQQVVDVNSALGAGVGNSATVSSDQPILAERFMSFKYDSTIPGATDVMGATSIGQVYTFAEGYTGNNFYEYLTLQNPQNSTTQVTVEYLPQYGGAPTIRTYYLAANSRYTIYTNQVMVSQSFSMVVLASQPIVAERPMYFAYNGTQTGGSDVVGYQP